MNRAGWIAGAAVAPVAIAVRRPARAQGGRALLVGDALGDPYAQGYYAVDEGFFRRSGLNVDFRMFSGGSPIAQAVASGMLDIGITTPLQIANAVEHGLPFTIIAPGGLTTHKAPAALLLVAKSSPITAARDLEGKTIAVNSLRSIGELAVDVWLEKNGADVTKVRMIETIFSEMGPALERGTIAAALSTEPALSASLRDNAVRVLTEPHSAIGPEYLISAWFTTQGFARENPDVVSRFRTTMFEVARWANHHQRETGDILVKYGKLDPALVRMMQRCPYAEQMRVSDMQGVLDQAMRHGIIAKPIAAADMIYHVG